MASIKIETGLKTYDIEDEKGNILGQISFNPTDENIIKRATTVQQNILDAIKEVGKLDNKTLDDNAIIEKLSEIDSKIRKEINYLFNCDNVSDIVFGAQNVLNTFNGKTFAERFLEAFIPVIKAEFEEEHKRSQERINNYTKRVQ